MLSCRTLSSTTWILAEKKQGADLENEPSQGIGPVGLHLHTEAWQLVHKLEEHPEQMLEERNSLPRAVQQGHDLPALTKQTVGWARGKDPFRTWSITDKLSGEETAWPGVRVDLHSQHKGWQVIQGQTAN